jgi:RecA/RadA recombinase
MDFLKSVVKDFGAEYAAVAADITENETFVDTGSYVLNALISGSIFGGISQNKISMLGAPQASGKTFIALSVVRNFLDKNPKGICLYFDTEHAITKKMLVERNLDVNRIAIIRLITIEEFRQKALKAVDIYTKTPENERTPCIMVLDSLGNLSTNKEIGDTLAEKDTRDMTKAALVKGAFRMLTLKLGQANIPLIVNNHVYDTMALYGGKTMSGGSGALYSSSTVLEISKSKEKEGTEVTGVIMRFKTVKSRFSKENQTTEVRLYYDERGLDRYFGLIELAEEGGIIPRIGNRYEINGKKLARKTILDSPEEYFTQELLEQIDEYAKTKFLYGMSAKTEEPEEDPAD